MVALAKLGVFMAAIALSYQFLSVKRLAIGGLALYKEFNRQMLALQGLTPDDAAHQVSEQQVLLTPDQAA
jgi:hypothetical protein